MVDKPEGSEQRDKTDVKETRTPPVVGAAASGTETTTDQTQAENTSKARNYGKYKLWPFIAIGWLIKKLDDYDGAVTALATIVIALLTWNYATIAKKQWKVMDRQLKESHQDRRPWVGIDSALQFPQPPQFEIYPTNRNIRLPVQYFLRNYGRSPALMANSYAFIFVEKQIANPPERTMADACGYVDGQRQEKRGVVIFPNEPKPVRIDAGHGTTFPSDVHTIGYIWIAVCTAYGDDMGGIHHTKTWLLTQPVANSKPVPVDSNLSYFPIREAKIASEETDQ